MLMGRWDCGWVSERMTEIQTILINSIQIQMVAVTYDFVLSFNFKFMSKSKF